MVVTKDRPLGPGRSIPMFIVVECEDHSAIQAPLIRLMIYKKKLQNYDEFSLKINYRKNPSFELA